MGLISIIRIWISMVGDMDFLVFPSLTRRGSSSPLLLAFYFGGREVLTAVTDFALRLPGFTLPIMNYWDGQGLR